jgi:hypothetical protein
MFSNRPISSFSNVNNSSSSLNQSYEKDKPKSVLCSRTKDGRTYLHISVATTLSTGKMFFLLISFIFMLVYFLGPMYGINHPESLKRRIRDLETKLEQKLHWLLKHKKHVQHLIDPNWEVKVHEDGRKHLLSAPGGLSRLAEALAPNLKMSSFDDHYLCGPHPDVTLADMMTKKIAIAAVTWLAPLSLRNSMESWDRNGLLDVVDEKMIFINSPQPMDHEIAAEFDFDVYETDEHNGNIMAGPSIAYLNGNSSSDFILFMEKDFELTSDKATMMREMWLGVQLLSRGVDVYRLRGKTDFPAEGMPDCCAPKPPEQERPTCPYHSSWKSAGYFSDHMNWLFIYCDPDIMEHSNGRLAHCTQEPADPDSYCYTSGETNWSNNPVLFRRDWFEEKVREIALMDFERNNMFEFNLMMAWLGWKPPAIVCSSLQGIFTHKEIDQ